MLQLEHYMKQKFYITTTIYYVNDVPHVGHAYTTLAADVIARYQQLRLGKNNVFFLTGTDEHGTNVAQAAEKHGQSPKKYADEVAPRFQEAWKLLNIQYDFFIRTTDPRHEKIAQEVLQKIYDNGYIYSGAYEGWYCVGCERFLTETDLVEGKCPLHPTRKPTYQKEKNYFLKLKELSKIVLQKIENKEYAILPVERYNEIVSRLKQGVEDISISRAGVSWGIPIPWDPKQTIYVWVEALLNYYTAPHFVKNHAHFWPPDVQLIGRDIVWFHAVIWQALLLAAEINNLPKTIFAHGFFTVDGQKMSKSLGNVISPKQLVDTYGTDGARYLLLSAYEFGHDGDLSFNKFTTTYNADLANGLGNLVARVAKLCESFKYHNEQKPTPFIELLKLQNISSIPEFNYQESLEKFQFDQALKFLRILISEADSILDETEPWRLISNSLNNEKVQKILDSLVEKILDLAVLLQPFLPQTSQTILEQFKGPTIKAQQPLFPRIL